MFMLHVRVGVRIINRMRLFSNSTLKILNVALAMKKLTAPYVYLFILHDSRMKSANLNCNWQKYVFITWVVLVYSF